MNCISKISENLLWVGGNDRRLNLFENAFPIPRGISYNSYLALDEKTVLLDTVDKVISDLFFENVEAGLDGRALDYVIVNHMEPDHAATLAELCRIHPETVIVLSAKAAGMVGQFFSDDLKSRFQIVKEGDTLNTGKHTYTFIMAPMVHWPEVMVTFEETTGTLFSADAFGTFGAISGSLFADELNFECEWLDDARRYYANIVGKYGTPVQTLLKKAATKEIKMICPLHGPIWRENIGWFVDKYQHWSSYTPEEEGVVIAYASIYGHTQNAAEIMARELYTVGVKNIIMHDVSVTHPSYVVSDAWRLSRIVFCSPTYNMGIFPAMETLLLDLKAHAFQNRSVGLIENGSWALASGKLMREIVESMKNMRVAEHTVSIRSAVKAEQVDEIRSLAQELCCL